MKTWTPDASEHFESWLGRVRLSVAGDPSINPDDVAQDLRAHVHAELETLEEPVTVTALDRVLDGLGNPAQWTDAASPAAPASKAAWMQRSVVDAITASQKALAGDWGMPIMIAAVTLFSLPVFDDGGAFVLACMYFIARSHVTHAPQTLTGRRKWLIYLPLAIGAGLLAGLVLAFPVLLTTGTFRGTRVFGNFWQMQFQLLWSVGAWWVVVGFLTAREPKRVQSALRPFADGFAPTHGRLLMMIGAALLITSTVMLLA